MIYNRCTEGCRRPVRRSIHIFLVLSLILTLSSCDLFFRKELRQDQQLAFYRHRIFVINDSLQTSAEKIKAYKDLVAKASEDKYLITPRKKNLLLSDIYTTMGGEYYDTYSIDEAIESNNIAIMLNITNQNAYYNRACLYQMLGQDSLAIHDYTKATEYDENYADAYFNRAILYENNTDFQLAVEDYSRAIKLEPPYLAQVFNNRGNVYQKMNFVDKAIVDYNAALKKDSTMSIAYSNRADAYLALGDTNKAVIDYQMAIQLDSSDLRIIEKFNTVNTSIK